MRQFQNIEQLVELPIDYMGMIFYEKSPRFLEKHGAIEIPDTKNIQRVGVFVNATKAYLLEMKDKYQLNIAQLHGDETPDFCNEIAALIPVAKAFRVSEGFDFEQCKAYTTSAEFFIFDTKAKAYGGTGKKFDWSILNHYKGKTPFLLSGGIRLADVPDIQAFSHPQRIGVDVNSGFETEPALKNIKELNEFVKQLNG